MIKKYCILCFVTLMALSSCRKDIDPLFTMELQADFEIPGGLSSILTHTFVIRDVTNPLDGYLKTYSVDTSQISLIQAGRGEITSIFNTSDYEFVEKVSVWMVDSDDPEKRREIYYLDFYSERYNNNSIRLLSSSTDIRPMLEKETFDLEIKLDFRNFSPRNIENRLIFNLIALE